jgi:hypothetical protein
MVFLFLLGVHSGQENGLKFGIDEWVDGKMTNYV